MEDLARAHEVTFVDLDGDLVPGVAVPGEPDDVLGIGADEVGSARPGQDDGVVRPRDRGAVARVAARRADGEQCRGTKCGADSNAPTRHRGSPWLEFRQSIGRTDV